MKKNNEILSVGVGAIIIGFIFMSISFFINERFISIISGVCAASGLVFTLIGKIIQKLDEVIEALSPRAAIEIDEALDRHRQWIEDAGKREVKWQLLQTDSTSWTNEDSSNVCTSTDRDPSLYWQPGAENW